jgi:hypothetical protein
MSNTPKKVNEVHEDLQPLRDVLDVRAEEIAKLNLKTGKELTQEDALIAAKVAEDIQIAMNDFEKNILPAYIEALPNTPERLKIQESDIWNIAGEVGEALGLSREEVMSRMGLQMVNSSEEFFDLDTEGVNEYALSEEEVRQNVYDDTVEGNPSLSKDILSVFHQYSNDQEFSKISTQVELVKFLESKSTIVMNELDAYYIQKNNPTSKSRAYSTSKKKSGMDIINSIGKEIYPATVQEWFNATNKVGFPAVNPAEWLDPSTGKLNRSVMQEELNIRISELTNGLTDGDIVNYKAALVSPDAKTKEGQLKIADYLETVPENYRNTDFESRYESYLEGNAEKGKSSKNFDEWVEESPKIEGIKDWLKKLIFTIPFLKDLIGGTKFGEYLGLNASTEDENNDAEFKKDNKGYTSYRAYLRAKEAEGMVTKDDILTLDWKDVLISGIPMSSDGKPNLSNMIPDDFPKLKKVLESENCKFAKTKNLTLEELVWINDNITIKDENCFTITRGDETNTFDYTTAGIEAAKECTKDVDIEEQIGEEYVDYFAAGVILPDKAFTDTANKQFATLQPALKSLLGLDKSKFWKGYELTDGAVTTFLANMDEGITAQGAFDNSEKTFEPSGDSFDVNGSGWFTDDSYESVENFIKSLK